MRNRARKSLLIPVLAIAALTVALPADAENYPYQTANESSGGTVSSTPAYYEIPYSAGVGRKVR